MSSRQHNKKAEFQEEISANCGACSIEFPLNKLKSVKLANWELNICQICLANDPASDYAQALSIIKSAQFQDTELEGPDVRIEPAESLIQEAVKRIRSKQPDYFAGRPDRPGVRSIVVGPSSGFGHVESGPGKDPNVIHIDMNKIKSNLGSVKDDEAIINSIIEVISHERGHISGFKSEQGFAGEGPAEAEAKRVSGLFQ